LTWLDILERLGSQSLLLIYKINYNVWMYLHFEANPGVNVRKHWILP